MGAYDELGEQARALLWCTRSHRANWPEDAKIIERAATTLAALSFFVAIVRDLAAKEPPIEPLYGLCLLCDSSPSHAPECPYRRAIELMGPNGG